ncbi:penicillin-binding protein 2 [Devosia sp. MC1541]|uniref:peptidoglycan D,D-transpeptidase FtsI family protein n=1 Tax=Devosia sp. MC1541 TaxID=2725264 RepID=UPI00145F876F|nr:penicillin-binding protein 2 [Devosia sp. MC1541]
MQTLLPTSDREAIGFATIDTPIVVQGSRTRNLDVSGKRLKMALWAIVAGFVVIGARLLVLGSAEHQPAVDGRVLNATLASRPVINDRNGLPMALDIRVPSLFAEPRRIIDIDEAAAAIRAVLPDLEEDWLKDRLHGDSGFAWLARELTPQQQAALMGKGIPGLDFLSETRRVYPAFRQASHVLGAVNVDNAGIAGIEAHIDKLYSLDVLHSTGLGRDAALEPVSLSIDMRIQNVLHRELGDALDRYQAVAAAGTVIDVHTGEIVGLVSLPDFDPNRPATMLEEGRFNRITAGKFEPASIFKPITIAGALDAGVVALTDQVDARTPVRFGRHSISDYYGKYRHLSVAEVLIFSSNIGTVRIAEKIGPTEFRAFLGRMGFDSLPGIELPEKTVSVVPAKLSEVASATVSFGHGLSVTPLQMLTGTAALVNGGYLVRPTLLKQEPGSGLVRQQVISEATSMKMRYLLRLNALEGSARRANALADGYRLGGKTGTAEKVVAGRYSSEKVTTFFSSVFPLDAPRYAMVVMVDEPQPEKPGTGRTAAYNAGDISGRIIQRIAPMLGVLPAEWENIPAHALRG